MRFGPSSAILLTAVAVGASAACLGACGGSGGGAPARRANVPLGAAKLSKRSIATLLSYTAGHAGKANPRLSPVLVGYVNNEGGAINFVNFHRQTDAAVALVNSQLGGIDGHPLELVRCIIVSAEEEGQACGERFANDRRIKAVMQFSVDVGAASLHTTLQKAKMPIFGALPVTIPDVVDPNGYYLSSGVYGVVPDYVSFVKHVLKAESVALVNVQGEPTSTSVARLMKQGFELAHIKVQQSSLQLAQTDLVGPLAAAGAGTAGVIIPLVLTTPQCVGMANTLKSIGLTHTPVLALYPCITQQFKKQAGGDYPQWYYASNFTSDLAPADNPIDRAALAAYHEWDAPLIAAGTKRLADPGYASAVIPLQTVLSTARHMNLAGPNASRARIQQVAQAWKGPIFLGPPKVAYKSIASLPSLPSLALRFYKYDGHGSWTDPVGSWLQGVLGGSQ